MRQRGPRTKQYIKSFNAPEVHRHRVRSAEALDDFRRPLDVDLALITSRVAAHHTEKRSPSSSCMRGVTETIATRHRNTESFVGIKKRHMREEKKNGDTKGRSGETSECEENGAPQSEPDSTSCAAGRR